MLGSIIGDIAGSIYEFDNIRTKDFQLFDKRATYTDDSILTIATADWLLHGGNPAKYYAQYAQDYPYPMGGYGGMFWKWAIGVSRQSIYEPYNSCGNGSAMRIGPVGWISNDQTTVLTKAAESAACTHNHPEGIKGAQATALCILMARQHATKVQIAKTIEADFGYDLSQSVEFLQQHYSWRGIDEQGNGGICQDSVPQAIICALKANDFEDAVRNAVSIGGDSDTIACITGSIAEPLFGIPKHTYDQGMAQLPAQFQQIVNDFEQKYGNHIIL